MLIVVHNICWRYVGSENQAQVLVLKRQALCQWNQSPALLIYSFVKFCTQYQARVSASTLEIADGGFVVCLFALFRPLDMQVSAQSRLRVQ